MRQSGFILVEALAALTLAALAAASLLGALNVIQARGAEIALREEALRQARYLLAQDLAGPVEETETAAAFVWSRSAEPHVNAAGLLHVTVEVHWRVGRKEGVTRLETYRFASR